MASYKVTVILEIEIDADSKKEAEDIVDSSILYELFEDEEIISVKAREYD